MPNEQSSYSEAVAYVLRALEQSAYPLTDTKLEKAIPKSAMKSKKDLPKLLEQMVKAGQIRCHKARSSVYWLPSLEGAAAEKILEALNEDPLKQKDLESKFKSLLPGWPKAKRDEMLAKLIKEKRVYKLPPLIGKTRASLLSARPADPHIYLQKPISEIAGKLQRLSKQLNAAGVTPETFFVAAQKLWQQAMPVTEDSHSSTRVSFDKVILDAMVRLDAAAANGALVSLTELRRSMAAEISGKSSFDQAVLRLAEQGVVVLHRHDHPSSLIQQERDSLVSDERGNYFIGISKV